MKIVLVTGFLAYQVICSFSSRSTDCVSIKEACVSESRACRSGWDLLKNVCRVSEEDCRVLESEECKMTIAYLLDHFSDWKGCLCTEKDYCRTLPLLAPDCHSQPGGQTSNLPPTSRGWFEPNISSESLSPEDKDCLSVLLTCQESPHCWSAYRKLKNSCSSDKDQCHNPASHSSCLLHWRELRNTPLANCTCPVGRKRCLKVQALLQNIPCIRTGQESPVEPLPMAMPKNLGKVKAKKDSKPEWQRSGFLKEAGDTGRSCMRVMTACVYDEVCNRQLAPLVRACSDAHCEPAACRRATQSFYRGLPHAAADALAFCECDADDSDCLHARADLHSGTCSGSPVPPPTCLEVYDRCALDWRCRQRYRTFQARCLGEGDETPCHAPDDCLHPPDPDLIPGGDVGCRRAFVGTMGTAIQQPCTCDGLQDPHLLQCQRIHDVFQMHSVFLSHQNKEVLSHHTTQEIVSQLEGQRYNDPLFFQLLCVLVIALILMVISTILGVYGLWRKAGKAKFHRPCGRKNILVLP